MRPDLLVLAEFGDFDKPSPVKKKVEKAAESKEEALGFRDQEDRHGVLERSTAQPLSLTVNLQIELPPSADGEVYDKLFAAMGKHLKGLIAPPR